MRRKSFIKTAGLASAGLLISRSIPAAKKIESCAPVRILAGTISSVKDGAWSDAATWGGRVPSLNDTPDVKHNVTINADAGVSGCNVSGTLKFEGTVTLVSTKNVVVTGALVMRPASANEVHTLRFAGVNESAFIGGGMDVLDSDTGLWCMGAGRLDLQGANKTAWSNVSGSAANNATQIQVTAAAGWQPGDRYAIAPTTTNDISFSAGTITSASGNTVNLSPLQNNHPAVDKWSAEIMNLTRNVRIEGTEQGRSHVFIRSTAIQNIRYASFRYMGPRKQQGGDSTTEMILGRYGLHIHHCMDIYGSLVEGCVVEDTNSHSFVPHMSHGITFRNNIAYNNRETAFWWDEGEKSHDIVYENNIVAKIGFVPRSLGLDTTSPTDPSFGCAGFMLGMGDDCIAKNNVVAGCDTGDPKNGGAYMWQANNEGVWAFENNLAHNCSNGVFIWQNSSLNHVLTGTDIYNCLVAVEHGAYANSYTFRGGKIYGCAFHVEASSQDTSRVRLENIAFDGGNILDYCVVVFSSPIPGAFPIFIRGCSFFGFKQAGIVDAAANELKNVDVIECTATGTLAVNLGSGQEVIRVQNANSAQRITRNSTTIIPLFASSVWSNGTGLKAEYFPNTSLSGAVVDRIDSNIAFQQWSTSLHHKLAINAHSMRWSGKVQAQYSQAYTFIVSVSGGVRVWVNNALVIDKWQEQSWTTVYGTPIALQAGQFYDIRVEYYNSDNTSGIMLYWQCASMAAELIPQSQLTPGEVIVTPPPVTPPPTQPTAILTLTASPNPTRSNWAIRAVSSVGGKIKLTVFNAAGQVQASAEVDSGSTTSYGASLSRGTYYLTAEQGSVIKTIQIIRQ